MNALRHLSGQRNVQWAFGAAAAALAVAMLAAIGALRLDPLPEVRPEPRAAVATLQGAERTPTELIDEAVAASPFTPSRQPSAAPARLDEVTAVPGELTLVGTVLAADGGDDSFVLVTSGNRASRVLRVGGVYEGYRLRSIGQASAVFMNVQTGERLELRVPRSR